MQRLCSTTLRSIFTVVTNLCFPLLLIQALLTSQTSESIGEVSVQINTVKVVPEIDGEAEKHSLLFDRRSLVDRLCFRGQQIRHCGGLNAALSS